MDSDSNSLHTARRSITVLALAIGGLFWVMGSLSLIFLVLLFAGVFHNAVSVSVPGALLSSLFLFLLGIPGILGFFLRKRHRSRIFLWICAIQLLLSGVAFPFSLKAPPLIALVFVILGAAGLWMAMVLLQTRHMQVSGREEIPEESNI